ncbi:IDEAL domain-containing protein [Solibacillus sp. FSL W8-0474]|uniref:IDEAL domain-containing protein n=1 Tax=Solibacillus sp. FSL W8-0474 TaxID=2975336 RepID=UPI0030F827BB
MAICSMCNDTGRMLVLERFCTCTIGKVQQRVARGAARAERLKEQEKKQKTEKAKRSEQVALFPEEPKKEREPFELYDWVEITKNGPHKGMICRVTDIQKHHKRVCIQGKGILGWAYYNDVKLAAISKKDDKDIKSLIDLALSTKDKAWFEELTGELETIK